MSYLGDSQMIVAIEALITSRAFDLDRLASDQCSLVWLSCHG